MPWCSVSDVADLTGAQVDDQQVRQAQAVIDLFSNVTQEASGWMYVKDRRRLARAVAYQAAWMVEQVDVFTRTEVSDVDQDAMKFKVGHEDALLLAPLARRWLMRLSWRRSRSVTILPHGWRRRATAADWLSESSDERGLEPWVPLSSESADDSGPEPWLPP